MMRTVLLLGFMTAILLAVGFVIGGFFGMTLALVLAIVINFVTYWYSDRIVIRIYRAKPTDNEKLNHMVDRLAVEAKIPKPRVYLVPSDVPNAFATGRNPDRAVVAVTEGLMNLDDDEIEGVLAHEIAHVRNKDILISAVAATIAGAISYLAQIGYWSVFLGGGRRGGGSLIGLIMIIIFAPLAAFLVKLAISRAEEYKADFVGATLTKKPGALASALKKINEIARENPMRGSAATSHMWIVNPFKSDWFTGLFSTHPPVARRVKRLEDMQHEGTPEPYEMD
ncbi:MAG: M48 family metalloprotease [Candidatus Aenigmarchaeota archaeon]|nr:M48 family metalloprotease [Candidatus Aenigmarchaeota archaeon]NIP40652.1 M48 family metalloprotease [Candidatus Aenigmarchaeota archaeon]NIQ18458.1 M48 family metalloprotease [Candidatus Aenigmarchaeota archaeon]NIS73357.1 M48 family metalloprotease [Candidatus Aenigmarchaeota archaeon]